MVQSSSTQSGQLAIRLASKKHPPQDHARTNELVRTLAQGVPIWNEWRRANPDVYVDLRGVDWFESYGIGFNLARADLSQANLSGASFARVDLTEANLSAAYAHKANFQGAIVERANLRGAYFEECDLQLLHATRSDFRLAGLINSSMLLAEASGANFRKAALDGSTIISATLRNSIMEEASFADAIIRNTDFSNALLGDANLEGASFVECNLSGARLDGCRVFGTSVWKCQFLKSSQKDLVVTPKEEPAVTVDSLKLAQFIYLILSNEEVREVIDTITSKVVLIIGRFTDERKAVLDAIRIRLREIGYSPIMFDFNRPSSKNHIETVKTLAMMARFVIADVTDAKVVLQEIDNIVNGFPSTPIKPIIKRGTPVTTVLQDFADYPTFLEIYQYEDAASLIANLHDKVVRPSEQKVVEIRERREAAGRAIKMLRGEA
jgi:uncharacterized protein YjbI with pentapeptide repeats